MNEQKQETKRRDRGTGRIFQYKNSPFYYIKYYAAGKPQVESTRSTRRQDAIKLLNSASGRQTTVSR